MNNTYEYVALIPSQNFNFSFKYNERGVLRHSNGLGL